MKMEPFFSATSLSENKKLREISLDAAIHTKFTPSAIDSFPVISQANIKYNFTSGKTKASVSYEIQIANEYDELLKSKIYCGSLQNDIAEFITQKIKNDIDRRSFDIKDEKMVILPEKSVQETLEKLKDFGFEVLSDDTNYFSGIYGKVSVDKILEIAKFKEVKDLLSINYLDVCNYRLFPFYKQQRKQCESLKQAKSSFVVFYGDLTEKTVILPKPILPKNLSDSDTKGRVFVQVKFDANGTILEAKAVSGNSYLFFAAEIAALSAKLSPLSINRDLNYGIGLIVYEAKDFQRK